MRLVARTAALIAGLACAQSVTADYYAEEDRGKAFGTLHLTSAAGAALGGLYATNVGERSLRHMACTVTTACVRLPWVRSRMPFGPVMAIRLRRCPAS